MRPIVNVPEEDRATDMGNMRKKLVKIARGSRDILSDRETDAQTYRHSHNEKVTDGPKNKTSLACGNQQLCKAKAMALNLHNKCLVMPTTITDISIYVVT